MSDDPRTFIATQIENGTTFECLCGRTWVCTPATALPLVEMMRHEHPDDRQQRIGEAVGCAG